VSETEPSTPYGTPIYRCQGGPITHLLHFYYAPDTGQKATPWAVCFLQPDSVALPNGDRTIKNPASGAGFLIDNIQF